MAQESFTAALFEGFRGVGGRAGGVEFRPTFDQGAFAPVGVGAGRGVDQGAQAGLHFIQGRQFLPSRGWIKRRLGVGCAGVVRPDFREGKVERIGLRVPSVETGCRGFGGRELRGIDRME
jgi:hypothetical protein